MDGVVYLLYGRKHALQLVVSLFSLRQRYKGPVTVLCGHDENDQTAVRLGTLIQADERLQADVQPFEFVRTGKKNNGYANKTLLHRLSPYDRTIFLDADTLVVGDIEDVFPVDDEIVLTQFCNWKSTGIRIAGRIGKWEHVCPNEVSRMKAKDWPAINTGVMGFTKHTTFMEPWRETTLKNVSFICDEIAAQLIFPDHPNRVLDHRFNSSVVYSIKDPMVKRDVRIWHGHGCKFFRKKEGRSIWQPWYYAAMQWEVAQLPKWTPYSRNDPLTQCKSCTI